MERESSETVHFSMCYKSDRIKANKMYGTLTCKIRKVMHVETTGDRAYGKGKRSE
jgi:hypothetical protein